MKFGKQLKQQMDETLPEWRDKFLSYKDLKKLVRLVNAMDEGEVGTMAEVEFIKLLDAEVDKFNAFFLEQEEDFIIRQKELQERIHEAVATMAAERRENSVKIGKIRRDIVNLHGEMVLLINYSNVNYTGLAKILKKYDKRTGRLLRLPFIDKVLKQPFFITDLISKLAKECENTIDSILPVTREQAEEGKVPVSVVVAEQRILRNTIAALVTMRELRRGSSTYSQFSLPPLNQSDSESLQNIQLPSPISIQ